MSAGQLIGMVLLLGILATVIVAPMQCEKYSNIVDKLVERQCGQIESRKEYARCVEEMLK